MPPSPWSTPSSTCLEPGRQPTLRKNDMKFKKTSVMLGVAALAALAAQPVLAQQDKHGWYAGGSIGRTGASIDDERIIRGLAGQGLVTTSIEDRDEDRGYKVFGGYQLHRNFAVEAGFFDLGS